MNKKAKCLIVLSLFLLAAIATTAQAENRYVIDDLIITLRTGQSTQHQIIETLHSGTKLQLLETGEEYSKVRAPDGKEGWVLNQYISKKPTAKLLLMAAESKAEKLQDENSRLKTELQTLTSKKANLESSYQKLSSEHKTQTGELERLGRVAAQPLKIEKENQDLNKQLAELKNNYQKLNQENQAMKADSERQWFLTGAGVTVLGIFIGLIAPRLRPKKKSKW